MFSLPSHAPEVPASTRPGTIPAPTGGINSILSLAKMKPDVVFLDQAPGEARVPCAQALKGHARFIVAHDLEADEPGGGGNYRWRDLDGVFKYQSVMKRMRPWTGVYSDVEECKVEAVDA